MSDNIMPMSAAAEGYHLFDKMKVQKGMPLMISVNSLTGLTRSSGFRSPEVRVISMLDERRKKL